MSEQRSETYTRLLERENMELRRAIKGFLDKHFHGGSKADRPDYVVQVPTQDIMSLKRALEGW